MRKKVHFVHLGMIKCMTTFLQTRWLGCENYMYSLDGSAKIEEHISQAARQSKINKININLQNIPNDGNLVLSNESFINTWPDDSLLKDGPFVRTNYLKKKREIAINSILDLTDTVLITVRNPITWIKSLYAHYVRMGGTSDLAKFIISFEDLIQANLDFSELLPALRKMNKNVVLLPCELYNQDKAKFWLKYESLLSVPKPSELNGTNRSDNITPYQTLDLHLALNQMLEVFIDHAKSGNCEQEIIDQALFTRKWLGRRAFEFKGFDDGALRKYFAKVPEIPSVETMVTDLIKDKIQLCYVNELIKHDPDEALFKQYLFEN